MKKNLFILIIAFTLYSTNCWSMEKTEDKQLHLLTLEPAPELQHHIIFYAFTAHAQEYLKSLGQLDVIQIFNYIDTFRHSKTTSKSDNLVNFANKLRSINSHMKAIIDDHFFKNYVKKGLSSLLKEYIQKDLLKVIIQKYEESELHKSSSILHWACSTNCKGLVNFLLLYYPDLSINERDNERETPLYFAIRGNCQLTLKLLLAHPNIKIDIRNKSNLSPFMIALFRENLTAIKLLLEHNNAIINFTNNKGENPLHTAVQNEQLAIVHLLLCYSQIDINSKTSNGDTALHLAIKNKNKKIVQLLLLYPQINLTKKNNLQLTPLELAIEEEKKANQENKRRCQKILQLLHTKIEQSSKNIPRPTNNCIIS